MSSRKGNSAEYATLFLARAILEGKLTMARAAIEAGADPFAFWIDGKTKLCDLANARGPKPLARYIAQLVTPAATKTLPPFKTRSQNGGDAGIWTLDFVKFVAKRGYGFDGQSKLLGGGLGSDIRPIKSTKAAVNLIDSKWKSVESIQCVDDRKDGRSRWSIVVGADWKGDRRVVGFRLKFSVDALGWDLLTRFEQANPQDRWLAWPDPSDPLMDRPKAWEGDMIASHMSERRYKPEDLIAGLKRGMNPFWQCSGKMFGQFDEDDELSKAFMDRVRAQCGPELGFHRRLAPLLTKAGLASLQTGAALESGTAPARTIKKKLTERTDTL